MRRQKFQAPTSQMVGKALAASEKKGGEFKEIVVERQPDSWGLADPVETFQERGFQIVQEGPRRVTMRKPMKEHLADTKESWDQAHRRLEKSDLGTSKAKPVSGQEIYDSLPDRKPEVSPDTQIEFDE
jgi:hypothetical protein